MTYQKYIYKLPTEDFYKFLVDYGKGVEILSEGEAYIEFALYEPLEGIEPLEVLEVEVILPQKVYKPQRIKNLIIIPSWLKPVVIRHGMAFGTGLHPTTRLCLELLEDFLEEGWSVLDVGTGTGILAIASKKLKAGRVLAIDIDPHAVEECLHNKEENCVDIECIKAEAKDVKESFDLLVANLELKIFKKELPTLIKLFKRVAIFSGIYEKEELREFLDLLKEKPAKIKKLKGWYAVVIKR